MDKKLSRKQTRLSGFDYSSKGYYFITFCTQNRCNILSKIVGCGILDAPQNKLTRVGKLVVEVIEYINENNSEVIVDKYVVMPNHIHLILIVNGGSSGMPTPTNHTVPKLISSLKRFTNKKCGLSLWQRSYHDRIIRDEKEYLELCKYIENNPYKWLEDKYYSDETNKEQKI